jgi:hypothetical protein
MPVTTHTTTDAYSQRPPSVDPDIRRPASTDPDVYPDTYSTEPAYSGTPYRGDRALSWGAIFAGAVAGAAVWLLLLMLGLGLGLSAISPWRFEGISATTFGVSTVIWLTLSVLVSAGVGGYLAGRLRTESIAVPKEEASFRDTAHGFMSWALASIATAALITSMISSVVGSGIQAGVASTAAAGEALVGTVQDTAQDGGVPNETVGYFIDSLFRTDTAGVADPGAPAATAESARIFVNGLRTGALPDSDVRYIGQVVADRTGLSRQEAEQRVVDTFARMQNTMQQTATTAREAADAAREASAFASLWMFIALLIGAVAASLAAVFGGRQRDA